MIYSSTDILNVLQGNAVVSASAEVSIVDKKPVYSAREGFFVYIQRYPTVDEFEATWKIWIESDGSEPDDLILEYLKKLLPNFEFKLGLLIEATVRELRTSQTKVEPVREAPPVMAPTGWNQEIEKRFEGLVEDIQDRMLLVSSGRPGKDGRDGSDGLRGPAGARGEDGKDMVATSAVLGDLIDVEIASKIPLEKGQVLTYDGSEWTNLYVPQLVSATTGGGGSVNPETIPVVGTTINWKYHTDSGEPAHRDFHTDVSDPTTIGILHVSHVNNAGSDVSVLVRELLATSTKVYVSKVVEPSEAHLYQIDGFTETAQGFEIQVTHLDTPGIEPAFDSNKIYSFLFLAPAGTGGGASSIDELTDVDTSTTSPFIGQTLVWDGANWVPGDSSEGIGEAPVDGNYYVRYNGQWVNMIEAINMINLLTDGGDFTQGEAFTVDSYIYDGGDLTANTSDTGEQIPPVEGYEDLDGGDFS